MHQLNWLFFQSDNLPIPHCVVETFEYDHSKISVIGTKWKKCINRNAASIQVVPCDTIVSHCLMLPYKKGVQGGVAEECKGELPAVQSAFVEMAKEE